MRRANDVAVQAHDKTTAVRIVELRLDPVALTVQRFQIAFREYEGRKEARAFRFNQPIDGNVAKTKLSHEAGLYDAADGDAIGRPLEQHSPR